METTKKKLLKKKFKTQLSHIQHPSDNNKHNIVESISIKSKSRTSTTQDRNTQYLFTFKLKQDDKKSNVTFQYNKHNILSSISIKSKSSTSTTQERNIQYLLHSNSNWMTKILMLLFTKINHKDSIFRKTPQRIYHQTNV